MPGAAAFLDLDKTIIARSSTLAFSKPLFKAGFLNRRALLKAGIAQAYYQMFGADHSQLERMRAELSNLTRGWDKSEIESLVAETVAEVADPLVFAEALAIIDQHRHEGRMVVVISSSPIEIVEPLCRHLGIDNVIATQPEIDEQGRFTGEIAFHAYGRGKAEAMRELAMKEDISLPDSFAYTDSATDLPDARGRWSPGMRESRPRPAGVGQGAAMGSARVREAGGASCSSSQPRALRSCGCSRRGHGAHGLGDQASPPPAPVLGKRTLGSKAAASRANRSIGLSPV